MHLSHLCRHIRALKSHSARQPEIRTRRKLVCGQSGRFGAVAAWTGLALQRRERAFPGLFRRSWLRGLKSRRRSRLWSRRSVVIRWPSECAHYMLQTSSSLSWCEWMTVTNNPAVAGKDCLVMDSLSATPRFYRLAKPSAASDIPPEDARWRSSVTPASTSARGRFPALNVVSLNPNNRS